MKWQWLLFTSLLLALETHCSFATHDLSVSPTSHLRTRWALEVGAENAHREYPRPALVRTNWLNLNGLWEFGLSPRDQTSLGGLSNQILVPFPVESQLSRVGHRVTENQRLWYRRRFEIPPGWQGKRVLLHLEAVDWEASVWVNGLEVGTHRGGYDRFSCDITQALQPKGPQELTVSVFDPSDSGFQPRGKQTVAPHPPFLSGSSGIWQTVWLEPVPAAAIESLKLVPDIDSNTLAITVLGRGTNNELTIEAVATEGSKAAGHVKGPLGATLRLTIPHPKLWSPQDPFLYDLQLSLLKKGALVDSVRSYFGMRKISLAKDAAGNPQLMLNNRRLFLVGPLDQGYWPEGLYTAPTDAALRFDIEVIKKLGFNLCRKHMKVEPERWYYWCDKLGLLVWQDMPSGDRPASAIQKEIQRSAESARQFELELQRLIVDRGNHPSVIIWTAFNQGWGQYDTVRIAGMVKALDPSRLVTAASGWNDLDCGDLRSLHKYPGPATPEHDGKRACVIGECGGLGLLIPNHVMGGFTRWNTVYLRTPEELTTSYTGLIRNLKTLKDHQGLAAAVITQLTDVERELNGFMTYDRAIIKMPVDTIRQLNETLIEDGPSPMTSELR